MTRIDITIIKNETNKIKIWAKSNAISINKKTII